MMYLMFFMGFVAVWVAGQISADVQAALGMVNQCGILLMVVAMAISSGATAAVSQSLGALQAVGGLLQIVLLKIGVRRRQQALDSRHVAAVRQPSRRLGGHARRF